MCSVTVLEVRFPLQTGKAVERLFDQIRPRTVMPNTVPYLDAEVPTFYGNGFSKETQMHTRH